MVETRGRVEVCQNRSGSGPEVAGSTWSLVQVAPVKGGEETRWGEWKERDRGGRDGVEATEREELGTLGDERRDVLVRVSGASGRVAIE